MGTCCEPAFPHRHSTTSTRRCVVRRTWEVVHLRLVSTLQQSSCPLCLSVQIYLASDGMTFVPAPPHSPDIATCNFLLFPKWKSALKSRRFHHISTKQEQLHVTHLQNSKCFKQLCKCWVYCTKSQRDHFHVKSMQYHKNTVIAEKKIFSRNLWIIPHLVICRGHMCFQAAWCLKLNI